MSQQITVADVIESLADFDKQGGASVGAVAWDLCVEPEQLAEIWQQAGHDGLIKPVGHDYQQLLYRLTAAGWAAYHGQLETA
jgi:hypothetical protein